MATKLLVGTKKGLAVFTSTDGRQTWSAPSDLHHEGWYINDAAFDPRTRRTWVCAHNEMYGPKLSCSDDDGKTWNDVEGPKNPDDPVERFWVIKPSVHSKDTLFCGSAKAQLWRSDDGGKTWEINQGIKNHPTRDRWFPGNGGLCLHSVVEDKNNPNHMWVGMSAVGVFVTEDGGKTWLPKNKNTRADFLPDKYPELGQCVHKLVSDAGDSNKLYQQNHCGMYRSDDGAENWMDIGTELPTQFGFPIAAHPAKPGMIWIAPQESDMNRVMIDGKACVYKSSDGGESWQEKRSGLPQENAWVSVLRGAMCTDNANPSGVYFGTTGGALFGSSDEGENWKLISGFLPLVSSVFAYEG